jgi:hypothetical protein
MSAPDNMSTQQSGQVKNTAGPNAAQAPDAPFWARYYQLTKEQPTATGPGPAGATQAAFDPESFRATAAAVSRLLTLAQEAIARRQFAEALDFLEASCLSDVRVRYAHLLKIDCLQALGRQAEADALARETAAVWPQMQLLRRTFRFLGTVANDGKRLLVGLSSKKNKK